MFYGGCDSCHVAKAPPKSTESTTLVHPDKVCWWGEKPCKYFDIFKALTKDMLQPASMATKNEMADAGTISAAVAY